MSYKTALLAESQRLQITVDLP